MIKKLTLLSMLALIVSSITVFGQAPEKFNYQAVARSSSGQVLANQSLGVRISIRSGSATGNIVYSETHTVSTNPFGLFTLEIGGGIDTTGKFSSIDWGSNSYFIETLMDPTGGSSYISLGTAQLLSVPFALHAKSSELSKHVPIAYGTVGTTGTLNTGTGNFTVAKTSTGVYTITITSQSYSSTNFISSATLTGSSPGMITTDNSNGNLLIRTFDKNGDVADRAFHFVVYKP